MEVEEMPTFSDSEEHIFLCGHFFEGLKAFFEFSSIRGRLEYVAPKESGAHRSQGLIEQPKKAVFRFGTL